MGEPIQPQPPRPGPSRTTLFILVGLALTIMLLFVASIFLLLRYRQTVTRLVTAPARVPAKIASVASTLVDYSLSNSVTVVLGENESSYGLMPSQNAGDGRTIIESIEGVSARAQRLTNNRTTLNFYFRIDPSFKQHDLSTVRIDVEYLDPQPGTMGVHYDAVGAENVSNPKYREAAQPVRLTGSGVWQKATFRTRGDASFSNRQNGQSDFRIWAKTALLYVRKITVTPEASPVEQSTKSYSTSNQVSVALGEDDSGTGGLQHLNAGGSRASIQTLDGVACWHLNRINENRMYASLYFAIDPSFKQERLKNARVEVEYLAVAKRNSAFRLQFDAMEGDTHRMYKPVLPDGARILRFGTGADYGFVPKPDIWSTATFHLTNAVFMNSQKDGADFRLEVVPPELYVRRVTVTRENP